MSTSGARRGNSRAAGAVYLDYCATGPVDARAVEAMIPYFTERFGAAECRQHGHGAEAHLAVERARAQVAALVGARPEGVVFTSGATESISLAIRGMAGWARASGRNRVVTVATEHPAVLEAVQALRAQGLEPAVVPVDAAGSVDLDALRAAVDRRTALVSVMAVNHETGVMQPLAEIAALCRSVGALFHCDAAQAAARVPLDMAGTGIHMLSLSGHKMHAPKGIGALVLDLPREVALQAVLPGGDEERGLRPGTLPVPYCVALGVAAAIASHEMEHDARHLALLTAQLWRGLRRLFPAIRRNGSAVACAPGILNVTIPGIPADLLMGAAPGVSLSSPADTATVRLGRGHVLHAMGLTSEEIACTLRLSLGRMSILEDVTRCLEELSRAAAVADVVSTWPRKIPVGV